MLVRSVVSTTGRLSPVVVVVMVMVVAVVTTLIFTLIHVQFRSYTHEYFILSIVQYCR
jgi:hypothetical protein